MRIAVNTRLLFTGEDFHYSYLIKQLFFTTAARHSNHQFLFITDKAFDSSIHCPKNVELVVVGPNVRGAISYQLWLDVKVPITLKKYKADVFINIDNRLSVANTCAQILIAVNLGYLNGIKSSSKKDSVYNRLPRAKDLSKATKIITISESAKENIRSRFKIDEGKIFVIRPGADELLKAIDWEEREQIKNKLADGCEYLIFVNGSYSNLINALKAFSIFKKWQKTNMKLLLVENSTMRDEELIEKLKTYKYREDVKTIGNLTADKLSKAFAAAYALLYPVLYDAFGFTIVNALHCELPIITSNIEGVKEFAGEAALYADAKSPENIADKMKTLFKDEQLRNKLIAAAKVQSKKFSWEKAAQLMWNCFEEAVSK